MNIANRFRQRPCHQVMLLPSVLWLWPIQLVASNTQQMGFQKTTLENIGSSTNRWNMRTLPQVSLKYPSSIPQVSLKYPSSIPQVSLKYQFSRFHFGYATLSAKVWTSTHSEFRKGFLSWIPMTFRSSPPDLAVSAWSRGDRWREKATYKSARTENGNQTFEGSWNHGILKYMEQKMVD